MPIAQIKAFSWLLAAVLTIGLSFYVYTFVTELKQRGPSGLIDQAEIKTALEDVPQITEQKDDLIEYQTVRRLFHEGQLNWTGYVPPPPPPPTETEKDKGPTRNYKPVADLLRVLMIRYDPVDEARSVAFVKYTPDAKVAPAKVVGGYSLHVGDTLEGDLDNITVKSIAPNAETGRLEVTFSFDEADRDPESLSTEQFEAKTHIVQIGPDGKPQLKEPTSFPAGTYNRSARRQNTVELSPNNFFLGQADIEKIAQDYPSFINEIRPKRHRDPRTGRYDGIEIGEVPAGSMGARHGAETGDIIKSINGHPVTSPAEAINFAKNNSDKYNTWEILIERRGKEVTITYTPD